MTLDGIVIHRNGLITGGQSGTDLQTRWQQHDVDGESGPTSSIKKTCLHTFDSIGAHKGQTFKRAE